MEKKKEKKPDKNRETKTERQRVKTGLKHMQKMYHIPLHKHTFKYT